MKTFKKISFVALALVLVSLNQSCGSTSEEIKDDQLSSFMLGGIYFINGYGGTKEVSSMMNSAGYTTNEELVSGYKEIFEFPFQKDQKAGIKRTLKEWWDITDKASLLKESENLKTKESKYKAWDYARIVNNACMGYGADFLSKKEVLTIVSEILPLAKEKYVSWENYYTDFDLGRKEWKGDDGEKDDFEAIAKNITTYKNSIYTILPLN